MAGGQKSIVLNIADNLAKAADLRGFVSEFIQSMGIQGDDKSSCTREHQRWNENSCPGRVGHR
jgi:hypothetical protein